MRHLQSAIMITFTGAALVLSAAAVGCSRDNDNRGAVQPSNPAVTNVQPIEQSSTAAPAAPQQNDPTPPPSQGGSAPADTRTRRRTRSP